jgi:hypothetical protein
MPNSAAIMSFTSEMRYATPHFVRNVRLPTGQKLKEGAKQTLIRMRKRDGRGRNNWCDRNGVRHREQAGTVSPVWTPPPHPFTPSFAYCVGPWLLNNLSTSAFTSALSVVPFLLPLQVVPSHKAVSCPGPSFPFPALSFTSED